MGETESLLVIDDEPALREVVARVGSQLGIEVEQAGTSAQARALMRERAFRLFFVDIVLPDESGLDLLKEIKQTFPSSSVVVMTGHVSQENAMSAMNRGAETILFKPFDDFHLIVEAIERAREKEARWQSIFHTLRQRNEVAA